jgi:riboflavin kinase/FMN adenylyltransferase
MELIRGIHNLRERHRGCVVTIGNYDGVHRGHQHMIAAVREKATQLGLPAVVVTFEPTPREFFEGASAPSRLTRLREKLEALALYGVDRVVVLRFDRRMQAMGADEFIERLLVNGLGVRHMVVGHDFHFARRREGTVATLHAAGSAHGFTVAEVVPLLVDGERGSS